MNKNSIRNRIKNSGSLISAAVSEMVGRTDKAEEKYGKIRARFGMYSGVTTFDASRTSYALARAIYFANQYKDSKTGRTYGDDYLLGAPFGKPIVNISAAFAIGAAPQITESEAITQEDDKNVDENEQDNPTIGNVNQWLEEIRHDLFIFHRNSLRDGDYFVSIDDDGRLTELPPEDVDIITDPFNPDVVIGYDVFSTFDDPEDTSKTKTVTFVDEIRTTYRRRMEITANDKRVEVPGTLHEYRSAEDGGLEERDLPIIHFANEKEGRSLYGYSEYQSLYYLMANYHAVLAAGIKGTIYNSNAVPVIQGVENMKQFLDQNFSKDKDGNYKLRWDQDKMLVIGKGGEAKILQGNGTAGDSQTILEILFWLIAQSSETPEFAFGTAVQSSKASVSEQTPMLVRKALRKQGQLEEPIRKLITLYIERMSVVRPDEFDSDTQFNIKMPDILDKNLNVNREIVNTLLQEGIITEETAMLMLDLGKYVKDFDLERAKAKVQKAQRDPEMVDIFGAGLNANEQAEIDKVNNVEDEEEDA